MFKFFQSHSREYICARITFKVIDLQKKILENFILK